MKRYINIKGNNQVFPYLLEYKKGNTLSSDNSVGYYNGNNIRLFTDSIKFYRDVNDWYSRETLTNITTQYIPSEIKFSKLTVYIPQHSITAYKKGVKYAITANTWVNGKKIDLGSFIFKPNDTFAVSNIIKNGNNEYSECIEFNIIDPFYIVYSENWQNFRTNVCGEPEKMNTACPYLQISFFVVDEINNRFILNDEYLGGCTNFNISDNSDYLTLNLSVSNEPLGFKFDLRMNEVYDWFLDYLYETYNIQTSHSDIKLDLVLKNKDSIIIGPQLTFIESNNCTDKYNPCQIMTYDYIKNESSHTVDELNRGKINRTGIKKFFSTWDAYEEGWSIVGSLTVYDDNIEIFSIVSNEVPVTQEVFSKFVNDGLEKIIDIDDMNITHYNIVNKIENKIVQLDRPNESKTNIIQPVFFRATELGSLTLHPLVSENISINLNDYKSKVKNFVLLIEGCKFNQIGANSYGILFKIPANSLPASTNNGTYYILDENLELVTTGKYNCIR